MRVLLVNPPFLPRFSRSSRSPAVTKSGTIYFPTWLAYATGVLDDAGCSTMLLDCPATATGTPGLLSILSSFRPDVVVLDSSTPSAYSDYRVAAAIKQALPTVCVVMVGTHVSALPEEALRSGGVDVVARGEYEYTLRALVAALAEAADFASVDGISYNRGGSIVHNVPRPPIADLDDLPFVSAVFKRHLKVERYFYAHLQHPMVSIFTSRGCPARCIWCVYPQVFYGHAHRHRSPGDIAAEFRYIAEKLPQVREILIDDDTFNVDVQHVRRTCEALIRSENRLPWTCEVRVNNLAAETMRLMRRAGCRLLVAGFESGAPEILRNIKKGTTPEQGKEFVRNAARVGLLVHGCFVAGQPGETRDTLQQTLNYALSLELDTAQFFPMMVYPGTEAFDWARESGALATEDFSQWVTAEGLHNTLIDLPGLTHQDLVRWCDDARRRFYLRPRYCAQKVRQAFSSWGEFKRLYKAGSRFSRYLLARDGGRPPEGKNERRV